VKAVENLSFFSLAPGNPDVAPVSVVTARSVALAGLHAQQVSKVQPVREPLSQKSASMLSVPEEPLVPWYALSIKSVELPAEGLVEACQRPQVLVRFRNRRANAGSPLTPFAERVPHLLNDLPVRQRS
jgi:hypothetical protein